MSGLGRGVGKHAGRKAGRCALPLLYDLATLRRDFRATVTYYHIQQRHPTWHRRHLRTTSRLERFNRTLHRHIRTAGAYHSDAGILAVIAQEADYRYPSRCQAVQS